MKRFLSIVMASVLMMLTLSTGLTAMAEKITTSTGSKNLNAGYTVTEGDTEPLTPVYDIDISVTNNLKVNYTKKYKQQWNNETHEIETVLDTEKSGWDRTEETVTIVNNSNVGVKLSAQGGGMVYGVKCNVTNSVSNKWLNPGEEYVLTVAFSGTPDEGRKEGSVGPVMIQIS